MHATGKYIEPITKKQFSESAKFDIHLQLQKVNIKFTTRQILNLKYEITIFLKQSKPKYQNSKAVFFYFFI
jgi:hypothetical protein